MDGGGLGDRAGSVLGWLQSRLSHSLCWRLNVLESVKCDTYTLLQWQSPQTQTPILIGLLVSCDVPCSQSCTSVFGRSKGDLLLSHDVNKEQWGQERPEHGGGIQCRARRRSMNAHGSVRRLRRAFYLCHILSGQFWMRAVKDFERAVGRLQTCHKIYQLENRKR